MAERQVVMLGRQSGRSSNLGYSYVNGVAREAGVAAEVAASRNEAKYVGLDPRCLRITCSNQ